MAQSDILKHPVDETTPLLQSPDSDLSGLVSAQPVIHNDGDDFGIYFDERVVSGGDTENEEEESRTAKSVISPKVAVGILTIGKDIPTSLAL
jgi:hypothetical protein